LAKERWLLARQQDLLPVPYFHIVFTLPEELNHLVLTNARVLYPMMFRSASETLVSLARDPRHLGGEIGLIAVLHTWGQSLMDHPHVHTIVPGGGLSLDGRRWRPSREHFFIPVKVLSRMFRGKMLCFLRQANREGKLTYVGNSRALKEQKHFDGLLERLYKKEWVVYAKEPFGGPKQVLAYLGRYTHRVAISNDRLVSMSDGRVTFRWRDYRAGSAVKEMTLDASEFIRRFLLHVLPGRLCKIRYYGILSNRNRKKMLAQCKRLLGVPHMDGPSPAEPKQWQELLLELTGVDVRICPQCHVGHMVLQRRLEPIHAP
jgi:hypothetical protein